MRAVVVAIPQSLRDGDLCASVRHRSRYANWIAGSAADDQLTLALRSLLGQERDVQFNTYELPYDYSGFDHISRIGGKPNGKRVSSRFSFRFSTAEILRSK